ncbi:hypothetical protein CCMA1212_004184 [Trichoderma ghanense]|uniref:Uncharacterized protein n=1 Tax=Trichoderma ghanense TaxID=65468 RepID=A0ABY2H607_9HYPO
MLDADAADAVNAGSGTMPSVSDGRVAAAGTAAATDYHKDTYLGARRAISCRAMVRGMCSCMLAQGQAWDRNFGSEPPAIRTRDQLVDGMLNRKREEGTKERGIRGGSTESGDEKNRLENCLQRSRQLDLAVLPNPSWPRRARSDAIDQSQPRIGPQYGEAVAPLAVASMHRQMSTPGQDRTRQDRIPKRGEALADAEFPLRHSNQRSVTPTAPPEPGSELAGSFYKGCQGSHRRIFQSKGETRSQKLMPVCNPDTNGERRVPARSNDSPGELPPHCQAATLHVHTGPDSGGEQRDAEQQQRWTGASASSANEACGKRPLVTTASHRRPGVISGARAASPAPRCRKSWGAFA